MDKDLMENVRKLAKVQAFLREDTNTIATLIQLTEDLAESLTITKAELERQKEREGKLVDALNLILDNFGYLRNHESMGNALLFPGFRISEDMHIDEPYKKSFRRGLDSLVKAKATLKELGIL